jgi:hypothetical protein
MSLFAGLSYGRYSDRNIDRQGMVTDRSHKYRPLIDRVEMWWFAGLLPNI